jgi:hypothetical protein
MPSEDSGAIALELEEARAAHEKLVATIEQRMRELDDLWRLAKPADRLLAIQRLIQTGALDPKVTGDLEAMNERVRELMSQARTNRKKLERLVAGGSDDHELRHSLMRLELEAQKAEQQRDTFIDEHDLRGPLYFCGETFVRSDPFAADEAPLKELAPRAKAIEELVKDLERKAPRKGVRFTTKTADGREQTLIRMLPALSMESEPVS